MLRFVLAAAVLAPVFCFSSVQAQVEAEEVFPGVTFDFPVEVAVAPGQPDRLYVVEKGEISSTPEAPSRIMTIAEGETEAQVFLDLTDVVWPGAEAGLLGMAFHPNYASNGKLYVYYGARGVERTVVAEYRRSETNPLQADPTSARVVIEAEQSLTIHNGGKIAFGPDGYLYVALGDGRGPGDVDGNGQDLGTLLGALLRINVNGTSGGRPYRIPRDNPFRGMSDVRPEIYAHGFRNPWKFSFDSETGDLWLGDVGETDWEEVNVVRMGGNYGWGDVEGPECFVPGCDLNAYEAPIYAYPHSADPDGGLSVTGGVVYRGSDLADLEGRYLFADFIFPKLWALKEDASGVDLLLNTVPNIASINEDASGEVLLTSYTEGKVYRLVQEGTSTGTGTEADVPTLSLLSANPLRDHARLILKASGGTPVRVAAFDARGRELSVLYDGAAPGRDLELDLDARAFAPGVVFVRLDSPAGRDLLPLTVVR